MTAISAAKAGVPINAMAAIAVASFFMASVELIVQPDAHNVTVETRRGLYGVGEEVTRESTTDDDEWIGQRLVVAHATEIIIEILGLSRPVRVEHPLETAACCPTSTGRRDPRTRGKITIDVT